MERFLAWFNAADDKIDQVLKAGRTERSTYYDILEQSQKGGSGCDRLAGVVSGESVACP